MNLVVSIISQDVAAELAGFSYEENLHRVAFL
jgi:hypothetical protein